MKKEQTIRIRTGQCFGRLDRVEPILEVAVSEPEGVTNEELKDELIKTMEEIVQRVSNKVDTAIAELKQERVEMETPVVASEVNVIATAALDKEVAEELSVANTPDEDEGKLEEVLAEKAEAGKVKRGK